MDVLKRPKEEEDEEGNGSPGGQLAKRKALGNDREPQTQLDVELFQKEAIWRRMQEYRSKFEAAESELSVLKEDLDEKRRINALLETWWEDLLDLLDTLTSGNRAYDASSGKILQSFSQSQIPAFETFLAARGKSISQLLRSIGSRIESHEPFSTNKELLDAALKLSHVRINELRSEISSLESQNMELEKQGKLLRASKEALERRLHRSESSTLRAIAGAGANETEEAKPLDVQSDVQLTEAISRVQDVNSEELEQLKVQNVENEALISKLKSDLQYVAKQSEDLHYNKLFDGKDLSEDAISKSESFRSLQTELKLVQGHYQSLLEEVKMDREELRVLKEQRTQFKDQLTADREKDSKEFQSQIAALEKDSVRVRRMRDDLQAQLQMKVSTENDSALLAELRVLLDAREARIKSLETEIALLKESPDGTEENSTSDSSELQARLAKAEKHNSILIKELSSMEQAYNKAAKIGKSKIFDTLGKEEKIAKSQAEKAKADQRYFAAMKAKDMISNELRALKSQTGHSKEIISKLQRAESLSVKKIEALEQQTSLLKAQCDALTHDVRQKSISEEKSRLRAQTSFENAESMKVSLDSFKKRLDSEISMRQIAEQNYTATKARLSHVESQYSRLKKMKGSDDSDELVVYRQMAKCGVCNDRWRNRVMTLCGHTFCKECIEKRVQTRQRRCPMCNLGFGTGDIIPMHL